VIWNWIKRHAFLVFVTLAVVAALGVCAALAYADYLSFVAQDVTPDLDPDMRWRMEYHAWETAHFGFWMYMVMAFPYLAGVLLLGAVIIASRWKP
jgi:hypothetical protein